MSDERRRRIEDSIAGHLRAAGEPVREAFLYERVQADGLDVAGEDFIAVLLRLEVEGHVHLDPVRDERVPDPPPFEPRFWRIIR